MVTDKLTLSLNNTMRYIESILCIFQKNITYKCIAKSFNCTQPLFMHIFSHRWCFLKVEDQISTVHNGKKLEEQYIEDKMKMANKNLGVWSMHLLE